MIKKRGLARFFISSFFRNFSITNWLILFNLVFFVFGLILISFNPGFVEYLALKPENIMQGKYLWTLITHMFMHGSFFHLFFNMFSLFFIGNFVEKIIGRKRFFWFYLLSGIIAGLIFFILPVLFGNGLGEKIFGDISSSGVGASGALFGLIGLLAVLTPKARVYLIAGPLIAIIFQAILSVILPVSMMNVFSIFISFYIIISIFAIFSFNPNFRKLAFPIEMPFWFLPIIAIVPLFLIGFFVSLPIGNTAHLGGLIVGLIYGSYLRNKYKKKIMTLNRMFR